MATLFQQIAMNAVSPKEKSVVSGTRTVYWLAKKYIASEKYNFMLNFLKLQGRKDIANLNIAKTLQILM